MSHAARASLPLFSTTATDKPALLLDVATSLANRLGQGRAITTDILNREMKAAFGGSAGSTWLWKDAYESLEVAQVLFLRKFGRLMASRSGSPEKMLAMLDRLAEQVPSHTRRSEEQVALQQFSTPVGLGYVAGLAAGLRADDVVLEPSAGTGLLAIFAELAGAKLALNELAGTRAGVLQRLYPNADVTRHDAEQLNDRLNTGIQPTVILMNPPFSASHRISGSSPDAALNHVASALARLSEGGRLVTITGANCGPERPAWRDRFVALQKLGRVVFSACLSGKAYARHGTTFETRMTVIDRTPAADPRSFPEPLATSGSVSELLDLVRRHVPIRAEASRPKPAQVIALPPRSAPAAAKSKLLSGAATRAAHREPTRTAGRALDPAAAVELSYETCLWSPPATTLDSGIYEPYAVQTIRFPKAKPHPTPLVQSGAMASVAPPRPSYRPHLPAWVVEEGVLTDAQLESVIFAGEAHSGHLAGRFLVDETFDNFDPAPEAAKEAVSFRRGWFLGDGTGVGKGRQVAGVFADNWLKGRRRGVWFSKDQRLLEDARRDFAAIGGDPDRIVPLSAFRQGAPITIEEGILFATYATLRTAERGGKVSRLAQIIAWLGRTFDGVIAFDEAHEMGNAIGEKSTRGETKPSQQGLAGLRLQNALPDARVLYVSATGASKISSLGYAARLGLWGAGDFPFTTRSDFIAAVENGGVAAMEVLARDLRSLGLYASRSLSYEGVEYEALEHQLTPEQTEIYNAYADAYLVIHRHLNDALKVSEAGPQATSTAKSVFESCKQRFFSHLLTAMKCPTLIAAVEADLEAGHAAIIQLVSTGEALLERRLAEIPTEEWSDIQVDVTPREYVFEYLQNSFPVQRFEKYTDEEGNLLTRPARDADGNPVFSQEALGLRQAMLEHLASLPPVQSALDQIIQHFGTDKVAEVTGRSRRIVVRPGPDGSDRLCVETRPGSANLDETKAFMDDTKPVLIFSDAGGTGRSYHADLGAKNQRLRVHYVLEPGWKADKAIQGLGRSNRTNQRQPPKFRPVATNVKGEKRFLATIARRLDTLGAITRGQRQTGGQGLFRPEDNLESPLARTALRQFYQALARGLIPDCSLPEFQEWTGLNLISSEGGLKEELPPITTFLNRLLALRIDRQNALFAALEERLEVAIEGAIASGTYDVGVETLRAEGFRIEERKTIYTHRTGAETQVFRIWRRERNFPLSIDEALAIRKAGTRFLVNGQSGRVAIETSAPARTDEDGTVIRRVRLVRPNSNEIVSVDALAASAWKVADEGTFTRLWEEEVQQTPEFRESHLHLITGLLLPIWDRLPQDSSRVYRLQTDDGERVIGRLITPEALSKLFAGLGLVDNPATRLTPEEAWTAVLGRGTILELSGGLSLRRAAMRAGHRVELLGFSQGALAGLKALGCTTEIIQYKLRAFVPEGERAGAQVLASLFARHPIIAARSAAGG